MITNQLYTAKRLIGEGFEHIPFSWNYLEEAFPVLYGLLNSNTYILISLFDRIWQRLYGDQLYGKVEELAKYGITDFVKEPVTVECQGYQFKAHSRINFGEFGFVRIVIKRDDINPYYDHGLKPFELIEGVEVIGNRQLLKKFFDVLEERLRSEIDLNEVIKDAQGVLRRAAGAHEGIEMLMREDPHLAWLTQRHIDIKDLR